MNATIQSVVTRPGYIPNSYAVLSCGHCWSIAWKDNEKVEAVGTEVNCETCDQQAEARAKLAAIPVAELSHSRYREWCGQKLLHVYRRDSSSPTGVRHVLTLDATPENEALVAAKGPGMSPLSPTEPR